MNELKRNDVDKDTVIVGVLLNRIAGKDAMKVQLTPVQNVDDLWEAFGYLLEAVGVTAASFAKSPNPKGISAYEDMANYVSEYLTRVIMSAISKEE